jgi:hypothetical protein
VAVSGPEPEAADAAEREILLTEYKALRDEILKKMDHRATFRVSALTLTVAAIGVGAERKSGLLLLLAPIVITLFSNLAIYHSVQIARAANYIRDVIEPKLDRQAPGSIGWHHFTSDRSSQFRQTFLSHHVPNLMIVIVPTTVAVALGWSYPDSVLLSTIVTVVDSVLVGVFLWNYYRHRLEI